MFVQWATVCNFYQTKSLELFWLLGKEIFRPFPVNQLQRGRLEVGSWEPVVETDVCHTTSDSF